MHDDVWTLPARSQNLAVQYYTFEAQNLLTKVNKIHNCFPMIASNDKFSLQIQNFDGMGTPTAMDSSS